MNTNIIVVFIGLLVKEAVGHGMMLNPPNRASLWRFNPRALTDYDDNANFCGGSYVQNELNGGKCGVCGDAYTDTHPQKNENTGKYGSGIVAAKFKSGSVIDVQIKLTANHLGSFTYSLCVLEDASAPESGEDCFLPLLLEDGSSQYNVSKDDKEVTNRVQLPEITCERCVLRWHYRSDPNAPESGEDCFLPLLLKDGSSQYNVTKEDYDDVNKSVTVLFVVMNSVLVIVVVGLLAKEALGHGMMLDPPNRASLWRFNPRALKDYDDNANFCGGANVQHHVNGGKCGVCGDSYSDPHPQDNENTGKYGSGIVAAQYESGSVIDVQIRLTANHMGTFTYSLCVLEDPNAPESGEDCFLPLLLEDGSSQYNVSKMDYDVFNRVQLPEMTCERCVLRWNYRAGNSWGVCSDQTAGLGCGPQETFRTCADISIN
ncbi:hypothetical protein NQ318_018730 [Aromia moschata]|uniref:Chitin-binding type-4 domain-containing protein n=1 Tax=Aromia moschata TaxID=1265417 RepID=A0AAV8ZG30_9CUCU|nr:hypothetical protein NQ318_018730 [Aromia moschata]